MRRSSEAGLQSTHFQSSGFAKTGPRTCCLPRNKFKVFSRMQHCPQNKARNKCGGAPSVNQQVPSNDNNRFENRLPNNQLRKMSFLLLLAAFWFPIPSPAHHLRAIPQRVRAGSSTELKSASLRLMVWSRIGGLVVKGWETPHLSSTRRGANSNPNHRAPSHSKPFQANWGVT